MLGPSHTRSSDDSSDDDNNTVVGGGNGRKWHAAAADVPCPCGQQLVGTLLGTLMGYNALLLVGPAPAHHTLVLACLSVGVAVGLAFSAAHARPATVCLVLCVVCFSLSHVAGVLVGGCGTLVGLLLAALMTSTAAHALLHFVATFGFLVLLRLPCPRVAAAALATTDGSVAYAKTCHV